MPAATRDWISFPGGCCLELDHELGQYPAAVFHLDTLAPDPGTDLGGGRAAPGRVSVV